MRHCGIPVGFYLRHLMW